ncbi:MAG: hypothetical protein E2598_03695 [Sphingobium sp.]|nr:hypothetical protein [Sphingobium sp.]
MNGDAVAERHWGAPMKARAEGNEKFLQDLHYLMQEMEKSFPQINHARRKFGINLRDQAEKLKLKICNEKMVYEIHEFYDLLNEYIFTPEIQRAGSRSWYSMQSNVGALTKDFYLEFFLRTSKDGMSIYHSYIHAILNKPAVVIFYMGFDKFDGYKDEIIKQAELNKPILSQKTSQGKLPVVVTDIPLEGKVGRLSIDMMGPNMLEDPDFYDDLEDRIFDFYNSIADYEHLVFDVRGNPGGYTPFVERMLVGPHISDPVELTGFVFFPNDAAGEHVRSCTDTFYSDQKYPRMHIDEMIDKGMLPDLDSADANILGTGAYNHWMTFSPTTRRSPFQGKIWILIDEGTGSASEVFAILAKQAGIACIIGEQSRGNYSKSRGQGSLFFLDLPNTGVVVTWDPAYFTDARGRHAHEYYVVPDHFNHSGMDALETMLEIIRN